MGGSHLSNDQIQILIKITYCIMSVYVVAFIFTTYNIVRFLIIQRRYKNVLMSAFYLMTLIVLIARLVCDGYLIKFYSTREDINSALS